MKIALFGGTGGTGTHILAQAMAQGHEVILLARTPEKVPEVSGVVTIVEGDAKDQTAVDKTVRGADVVISALGSPAQSSDMVEAAGTQNIIESMKTHNVSRLIVITSIGLGDSIKQVPFAFKTVMKTFLRKAIAEKTKQEALVMASELDWIIVRPGGLSDEPASGQYQAGMDKSLKAGRQPVSRADVAAFVLKQISDDTYLGQTPVIV